MTRVDHNTEQTALTELQLRPPFTGFVIDQLRLRLWTAPADQMPYLDDIMTRLEAKTNAGTAFAYPAIHGFNQQKRLTTTVPLYTDSEIEVLREAFTVSDGVCTKPMCDAICRQLPPVE